METTVTVQSKHILMPEFRGVGTIRNAYDRLRLIPTSENADVFLIRSHIAYWSGATAAERIKISRSRGHSYRISQAYHPDRIARITDHYDHREGVALTN